MPAKGYVGMSVTPEARDGFRQLVYAIIGRTGRRVEMSEALVAVTAVALRNMDEIVSEIEGVSQ